MKIISVVLLTILLLACTNAQQQGQKHKSLSLLTLKNSTKPNIQGEDKSFLYVQPFDEAKDEYKEGNYYVYNIQRNISVPLTDTVIIDYSFAWLTPHNQAIILDIGGISLFDEYQKKESQLGFSDGEAAIGGGYDPKKGILYFLLKNTKNNQIDLCQFTYETKVIKKIKTTLNILGDQTETPFINIEIMPNGYLYIEDNCVGFYVVNLENFQVQKVNYDKGGCISNGVGFNREGLIYVKYRNPDRTSYEIKQYFLENNQTKLLLEGENKEKKPVNVFLFCNKNLEQFIINIDRKNYLYNPEFFKEIPLDGSSKVVFLSREKIYYLTTAGTIKSLAIDEK